MRIGSFEFSLRELAGSMGDYGTLFPLAIGYIAVCGLDPAGLLVMMGLANIATGLAYRLPMPIEPMKVIAVVAIAQAWPPSLVYAAGIGMGLVWLILGASGLIDVVARVTPHSVVRGIQVALGAMLAIAALKMIAGGWVLAALAVAIIVTLREHRYAPAAVVLVALGVGVAWWRGDLAGLAGPELRLPRPATFTAGEIWRSLVLAGFAQIPLTATNAVLSTSSLISTYWPDRKVTPRQLALNHGAINLVGPLFGGMATCHGAGGLAGQYFFGARTGGTNIIEGSTWLVLGLLFSGSIAALFTGFPVPIVGAMMLMVGLELLKFARDVRPGPDLVPLGLTVAVSLLANMAWGFAAGLAAHHLLRRAGRGSRQG